MNGQTARVYAAEESWIAEIEEGDDALAASDVERFVGDVMRASGWAPGVPPTITYDVSDAHELAGWFDSGGIHLDPSLVGRHKVLHELAHYLRPNVDGHGPQFCAVLVDLVRCGISPTAADELLAAYAEHDVLVDSDWLDL